MSPWALGKPLASSSQFEEWSQLDKLRLGGYRAAKRIHQLSSNGLCILAVPGDFPRRVELTARFPWAPRKLGCEGGGALLASTPASFQYRKRWGSGKQRQSTDSMVVSWSETCKRFSCLDENFSRALFTGYNLGRPAWNHSYQPRQGKHY